MSDWCLKKDRKGKKNKKKQKTSMSEPVDLEAGKHVAEPEAADMAKAVYNTSDASALRPTDDAAKEESAAEATGLSTVESSKSDIATEDSTQATGKDRTKTTKAHTPPPPKAKAKVSGVEDKAETVQDEDAESEPADVVVSDTTEAETVKDCTQEEASKDAVNVTKAPVPDPDPSKIKVTSKKALKKTTSSDSTAQKSKGIFRPESSKADTVRSEAKQQLRLVPLVSAWSFAPEPPRKSIIAEAPTANAGHRVAVAASCGVPDPPLLSEAKQDEMLKKTAAPAPSTPKKATKSHGLPPLPPFDHAGFSRIDNTRRPTINDHGPILKVQIDKDAYTNVHEYVLCQTSAYFQDICDPSHDRHGTSTLTWDCTRTFKGITPTYVHWLYNNALPRATIDTSDETRIGAVLLHLAEQYVLGNVIRDRAYQNAIMDHFVTIHVRTRKLAFRSVIEVVYRGTRHGSPMRRLLADMHAFIVAGDVDRLDLMDDMPKAFVTDVLESVLLIRPNEVDEWWHYLVETGGMYHSR